jgi:hypothetical protein
MAGTVGKGAQGHRLIETPRQRLCPPYGLANSIAAGVTSTFNRD